MVFPSICARISMVFKKKFGGGGQLRPPPILPRTPMDFLQLEHGCCLSAMLKLTDTVRGSNLFGSNLLKKVPPSPRSHLSFLSGNFPNSIFLDSVSHEEITNIVAAFRSNTASGFDQIPMWLLKRSIHLICQPLTCIINISISTGIVPEGLKIARVVPLFKSNQVKRI